MKITDRFLSVTLSVLIGLSALTASANADTADVDYDTNTGTDAISPIINDTPNEYKFSLPDSEKTYVLIDSYKNESGKKNSQTLFDACLIYLLIYIFYFYSIIRYTLTREQ